MFFEGFRIYTGKGVEGLGLSSCTGLQLRVYRVWGLGLRVYRVRGPGFMFRVSGFCVGIS